MPEVYNRILKTFNDPVHGFIELNSILLAIVDTTQFQRLRYIKQLGPLYLVYFGAGNCRFEHSIGTCYLAGLLVRRLKQLQPDLEISEKDVLCVEIAGLCHDLGHGPFSHSFEHFMGKARPERKWKHEEASIKMFDFLVESNKTVKEAFRNAGLSKTDEIFIKDLINGIQTPECGRDNKKAFLFNIVANKENGIDVDKFDYFARDCHHTGLRYGFDHLRVIKNTKVLFKENGKSQICYRDKIVNDLGDMFQFRYLMHRRAYQHRTVLLLEHMILEVLLKAGPFLKFPGENGKMVALAYCVDDMVAYSQLRDSVIDIVRWSTDERLSPAKAVLQAIERRELYKIIGEFELKKKEVASNTSHTDDIEDLKAFVVSKANISAEDIVVKKMNFSYGVDIADPLERILFYEKGNFNEETKPQQLTSAKGAILSRFNADNYAYSKGVFYLKNRTDPDLYRRVFLAFEEWYTSKNIRGKANLDFTPYKNDTASGFMEVSPLMSHKRTGDNGCRRTILD